MILTNRPSYFQHTNVFETSVSDFHLMTVTEFKMSFQKATPKIITCRDYKKFDNDNFSNEIKTFSNSEKDLGNFMKKVYQTFNTHAPMKKRYIRANNTPFMNKELHKAIMK